MTDKNHVTHYVAIPLYGIGIHGFGSTPDAAIAHALDDGGPFHDAIGNQLDDAAAKEQFRVYPASKPLIERIEERGGLIEFDEHDGTIHLPAGDRAVDCAAGCESNGVDFADLVCEFFNVHEAGAGDDWGEIYIRPLGQNSRWLNDDTIHKLIDWIEWVGQRGR